MRKISEISDEESCIIDIMARTGKYMIYLPTYKFKGVSHLTPHTLTCRNMVIAGWATEEQKSHYMEFHPIPGIFNIRQFAVYLRGKYER